METPNSLALRDRLLDEITIETTAEILISDTTAVIFHWFLLTGMCLTIDVFGVVTNIINIICFVKQGFNDPVNVSLVGWFLSIYSLFDVSALITAHCILGLAVSDLLCLTTLIWTDICYTPAVVMADLPFHPIELNYLTSGIPHVTFTRVTAWITALITLERCLCIAAPLKVKSIITSRRVAVVIICVFVSLMLSVAPVNVVNRLGPKFIPERNRSIIGLIFTNDRVQVESISFLINNAFIPFTAFVIIIVSTAALAIELKRTSNWRQTNVSTKTNKVFKRNRSVAKMVVIISVLFIACFIPANVMFIAMVVEPKLAVDGKYRNVLTVVGSFGLVMESVNSSGKIFVYYYMSSKFRAVFEQVFL